MIQRRAREQAGRVGRQAREEAGRVGRQALDAGARIQQSVAHGLRTSVEPIYRPGVLYGALVVVVLSLVALIVVPTTVQREIEALHDQLDQTVDPAAQQVRELRYYMARQMALARGYALTGDPALRDGFQQMRDAAGAALLSFPPEAMQLSSVVAREFGAASAQVEDWHAQVTTEVLDDQAAAPAAGSEIFERALYEQALSALDELETAIEGAAADRRARIR